MAHAFNSPRRSQALNQLCTLCELNLVEAEELEIFSENTRKIVSHSVTFRMTLDESGNFAFGLLPLIGAGLLALDSCATIWAVGQILKGDEPFRIIVILKSAISINSLPRLPFKETHP
ncbi:MAG: hypothetical protein AAF921_21365 [Cyanobacteria bacterium P01_D01_bin.44]